MLSRLFSVLPYDLQFTFYDLRYDLRLRAMFYDLDLLFTIYDLRSMIYDKIVQQYTIYDLRSYPTTYI
jgi:hypothetical protein